MKGGKMRGLTAERPQRDSSRTMSICARCGFVAQLAQRMAYGAVLALVLVGAAPAAVSAQQAGARPAARAQHSTPKAKRARGKAAASAKKPKSTPAREKPPEKPVEEAPAPKPEREAAAPTDAQTDAASASTETPGEVRSEGDTQVKMMEFSGLDIEGQLKTPQMLYFLNRLRAEFGRPKLPHRSFMPELQRGTQEQAQR